MKILVTGGAGFIGSHLVDELVEKGHEVAVIDNLSTGKKDNLNPNAEFHELDINSDGIVDILKNGNFTHVIHQAAQVRVTRSLEDPVLDATSNIVGSINLLENCRRYGVERFVYGNSGGAMSGNQDNLPMKESHPVSPESPYGVSKHTVEHYLAIYNKLYNLDYVSLRYPNVYGPRQDSSGEGGVVAIFCNKLVNDERPVIFGDGEQTRDFTYVKDVVNATVMALEKGSGEFNISTSRETSVNELYEKLLEISGKNMEPVHGNEREGELRRSVLDNSKAMEGLGWEPIVSLDEGLKLTFDYFNRRKE
ncbi:MAG: GDP-mannose 4,6-dehydratase [Candidatus Altiarchaeales archaeon]|nr:GDP-mannose 4,6-dehydratase [Candidatus Altiarchaeota archaeon]MBU4342094.1 GDP-mannose 4,6-dehydratase [Candidatus Altiarchaeota archaeon]MBU4436821.1 GDP-mannose 4,6-dehydratase [Candidatus Altiarchaeota archaeon]MCG2783327.1 GDP-mannose 4,6-dehydratase [Candidatus Altiarchaeales archaeon]